MGGLIRFCERGVRAVDLIAAIMLAAVTLLIVASAFGRYLLSQPIPESFDLSRLLLGISIAWGFAVLGYRGGHITVDIVAEMLPRGPSHVVALIGQLGTIVFSILLAWKGWTRLASAYASREATFDLHLPVWPLVGGIWLGFAAAVFTGTVGLLKLIHTKGNDLREPEETLAHE